MKERILVVGNNVRNIVQSAFKAGYEVYALTSYLDSDLLLFCEQAFPIEDDNKKWVAERVDELVNVLDSRVVLTSGYEDLSVKAEVLGCEPRAIKSVVNKLKFYRKLETAGLPFPEILEKPEGRCILKPVRGGGGEEIRILDEENEFQGEIQGNEIHNETHNETHEINKTEFLIQQLIEGFPCSVSLIIGREIEVIALNEILAGWGEMNAKGFRYCGNITPLIVNEELRKKLTSLANEVCGLFELRGSVGVDFVVERSTMSPYILEINPRFQGSLDSIEWSTDLNLFNLHMKALEERTGKVEKVKYFRYAIRAISFADRKIEIRCELLGNPFFADIPSKGTIYGKDDPVVSILASGVNREEVLEKAVERKKIFLELQGLQ
ncbi:MAG: ATP-grasp domain-containing protein [Archaeoglobus sp.]|nr:ATP-grasp domain-containing protein [Archaeoglobus sp.]